MLEIDRALKSSYSVTNCVMVTLRAGGVVDVAHSRQSAAAPSVRYSRDEWVAFVQGVKAGEFDIPAIND